jgi:hypothetical protein
MPTYILYCNKCQEETKRINIKVDQRHKQKCEKCNSLLKLIITPVNFKIKGFSAKNRYGLAPKKLGELMDEADRRAGRIPRGEKLNEKILSRKTRKKMPELI